MAFDDAALAKNWKAIVAVDLGMGLAVVIAGVLLALTTSVWGWVLSAAGLVQLFFAGGRLSRWRRLRNDAGL